MWIYILVGVIAFACGWAVGSLIVTPHTEGAIIIENGDAYLQLNHEPEKLAEHEFVTFRVISRK